jgi:hypothetical protein
LGIGKTVTFVTQNKTKAMSAATTILEQLGGNKFIAMTGSKNFIDCGNGITMHLITNKAKAKYLKIEITDKDTYKMTFSTVKKFEYIVLEEIEGVYAEMLQDIFTTKTGLLTSMGTMKAVN